MAAGLFKIVLQVLRVFTQSNWGALGAVCETPRFNKIILEQVIYSIDMFYTKVLRSFCFK